MDTKHTPGKWLVDRCDTSISESGDLVVCIDIAPEIDGYEYRGQIAYLQSCEHIDGISVEEAKANARLIATAPELLKALRDILRSTRKDFEWSPDGERKHKEAYSEQFNAIAKATGENHG